MGEPVYRNDDSGGSSNPPSGSGNSSSTSATSTANHFVNGRPSLDYTAADYALRRRLNTVIEQRQHGVANPMHYQRQQEGAALYRGFLNEEFQRRNLPQPSQLLPQDSSYHRLPGLMSADVIQAGSQLRSLSAEFSQSPMRQWVEERAASVPLDQLDFNAFSELLYALFQEGGVTWERVMVLFFFCVDLSARAVREQLPLQMHNIFEWSLSFFTGEKMIAWIVRNGGWIKVLQKSIGHMCQIVKLSFLAIGVFAVATYLWKSRG